MRKNDDFNDVSGTPREQGLRLIALIKTKKDGASGNSTLADRCRALIEAGADLETRDESGMTPLMCVAANFRSPIFAMVLERAPNVLARDKAGLTALDHAIKKKSKPAIAPLQAAQQEQLDAVVATDTAKPVVVFKKPLKLRPRGDKSPA